MIRCCPWVSSRVRALVLVDDVVVVVRVDANALVVLVLVAD